MHLFKPSTTTLKTNNNDKINNIEKIDYIKQMIQPLLLKSINIYKTLIYWLYLNCIHLRSTLRKLITKYLLFTNKTIKYNNLKKNDSS